MGISKRLIMVMTDDIYMVQNVVYMVFQFFVIGMLCNGFCHFKVDDGILHVAIAVHSQHTSIIIGATAMPLVAMQVVIGNAGRYQRVVFYDVYAMNLIGHYRFQ